MLVPNLAARPIKSGAKNKMREADGISLLERCATVAGPGQAQREGRPLRHRKACAEDTLDLYVSPSPRSKRNVNPFLDDLVVGQRKAWFRN